MKDTPEIFYVTCDHKSPGCPNSCTVYHGMVLVDTWYDLEDRYPQNGADQNTLFMKCKLMADLAVKLTREVNNAAEGAVESIW